MNCHNAYVKFAKSLLPHNSVLCRSSSALESFTSRSFLEVASAALPWTAQGGTGGKALVAQAKCSFLVVAGEKRAPSPRLGIARYWTLLDFHFEDAVVFSLAWPAARCQTIGRSNKAVASGIVNNWSLPSSANCSRMSQTQTGQFSYGRVEAQRPWMVTAFRFQIFNDKDCM